MKKKFTFVDAAIIIVIIAVIAGSLYYLLKKNIIKTDVQGEQFGYTLKIMNIPEQLMQEFDEGDQVTDSTKLIPLGTIDKVTVEPYEDITLDQIEGKYLYKTVEDNYTVTIHVTSPDAVVNENEVLVNNYELYYGKTVYIRGENFATSSTVWGIDGAEEEKK